MSRCRPPEFGHGRQQAACMWSGARPASSGSAASLRPGWQAPGTAGGLPRPGGLTGPCPLSPGRSRGAGRNQVDGAVAGPEPRQCSIDPRPGEPPGLDWPGDSGGAGGIGDPRSPGPHPAHRPPPSRPRPHAAPPQAAPRTPRPAGIPAPGGGQCCQRSASILSPAAKMTAALGAEPQLRVRRKSSGRTRRRSSISCRGSQGRSSTRAQKRA